VRAHIESQGIEFRLRNLTKLVRQVLEITRLDSIFEISTESELLHIPVDGRPASTLQAAACA
jgi:anti-anti-sigma regulatory factor